MRSYRTRPTYGVIILTFIFAGFIKTDRVSGHEWPTATAGWEAEPQPHSEILNLALSPLKALMTGRGLFGIDSLPAGNRLDDFERLLHQAILQRIGVPYRSGGNDDKGYDCSGFVWRIFQDAGVELKRSTARDYWESLPEATDEEQTEFGTLVFFDHPIHMGVVRDSYSFYHSASSTGVTRSNFSCYWGEHIKGFRRIPLDDLER
ncbi:MAG TPA: NlpC/P60 family protein [Blastocatellia bacterium]|nr:NlpC/P60 family protein [Blastocatellia bacterium]